MGHLIPSQSKEDHTRLVCRARACEETEIPQGTEARPQLTWRRVRAGRGAANWFLRLEETRYDSYKYFLTVIILNNIILTRFTWNKQACSKPSSVYLLEKHQFHLQQKWQPRRNFSQQADRKSFALWSVNISFLNYLEPFFRSKNAESLFQLNILVAIFQ